MAVMGIHYNLKQEALSHVSGCYYRVEFGSLKKFI